MCFFVLGYDLVLSVRLEIKLASMKSFRAEKPLYGSQFKLSTQLKNQMMVSIVIVLAVVRVLFHYLSIFHLSYNFE